MSELLYLDTTRDLKEAQMLQKILFPTEFKPQITTATKGLSTEYMLLLFFPSKKIKLSTEPIIWDSDFHKQGKGIS
jgi:hypothetical protein